MNKAVVIFTSILVLGYACTSTKSPQVTNQPVILKVGNSVVPTSEFKYVYNKNNANTPEAYSEKSIREYLDLYIKFRLKVKQADDLGLDTTVDFKNELNGYKKQLAQPYLTEKGVTEKLIKQAYERMGEEVKAAHILIRVAPEADPKDTLEAFNRAVKLRERVLAGENFESLAKSYSEDPSAQTNGGSLGYFTALQMVYPFEEGAYTTPIGQISKPVRSRFGYHIIKVIDRRKSQGEVKVAHIMVRFSTGGNPSDSVAASQKIKEIYGKLQKGEKWETLCTEFSDDMNSRGKGGELPAFSTGNMIPSFEDAAFRLNTIGEYSQPIQTPYGFHIIKLLDKKGLQKFEEMESTIKSKVAKDSRSDLSKTVLLNRLKRENNFTENNKAVEYTTTLADSSVLKGKFTYDAAKKENQQLLFSVGDKKYNVNDFLSYVKTKSKKKTNITPKYFMSLAYKDFVNETLIANEEANLEKKYEDYRMLVKEYRDGILLFQLMDTKVWSKAIEDTTGLRKYYNDNKENYRWGRRCVATIFNCKDAQIAENIKAKVNNTYFEVPFEIGGTLAFVKGKVEMAPTDKKKVDEIKNVLSRDAAYVITITSMASAAEGQNKKVNLSAARLSKIVKYLKSIGVDSSRIKVLDLGTEKVIKGKKPTVAAGFISYRYVSTSVTALEKSMNNETPLTIQIKEGKFQAGDDPVLDAFTWKYDVNVVEKNDRVYVINIKSIIEPSLKTFEEARGQIISDYQNYLEKEWITELRKKYTVITIEEEVKKLIKQ